MQSPKLVAAFLRSSFLRGVKLKSLMYNTHIPKGVKIGDKKEKKGKFRWRTRCMFDDVFAHYILIYRQSKDPLSLGMISICFALAHMTY